MDNSRQVDGGNKMAQKWVFEGVFHVFSIVRPFFGHFSSLSTWGLLSICFSILSPFPFFAVSMPCQPGMIPRIAAYLDCGTRLPQQLINGPFQNCQSPLHILSNIFAVKYKCCQFQDLGASDWQSIVLLQTRICNLDPKSISN